MRRMASKKGAVVGPEASEVAVRARAYEQGRDALLVAFGSRAKPTAAEAELLDEAWRLAPKRFPRAH